MASTQATQHGGQPRQSLRRFDLASVSINDSLNKFKDPQLVLKTQVDLAPRVPYTGSRARKSVWRHLLLIHVRDKADELEKLDLDAFAVFSKAKTATGDYSLEWYSSENILVFRYPKDRGNVRCIPIQLKLWITILLTQAAEIQRSNSQVPRSSRP